MIPLTIENQITALERAKNITDADYLCIRIRIALDTMGVENNGVSISDFIPIFSRENAEKTVGINYGLLTDWWNSDDPRRERFLDWMISELKK